MNFKKWLTANEEMTTTAMVAPFALPVGAGGLIRRDMYGTIPRKPRRRRSNNRRHIKQ